MTSHLNIFGFKFADQGFNAVEPGRSRRPLQQGRAGHGRDVQEGGLHTYTDQIVLY